MKPIKKRKRLLKKLNKDYELIRKYLNKSIKSGEIKSKFLKVIKDIKGLNLIHFSED